MGSETTEAPKETISTEEAMMRANGRRLRSMFTSRTQQDRMEMAERYRAERGLSPPTEEQLAAAGVPPKPKPTAAFRRGQRAAAGTIVVLVLFLVVLLVVLYIFSKIGGFFSAFHLLQHLSPLAVPLAAHLLGFV